MNWQLAVIIAAVALSALFVLWRVLATFTKKDCGDCCGKSASRT